MIAPNCADKSLMKPHTQQKTETTTPPLEVEKPSPSCPKPTTPINSGVEIPSLPVSKLPREPATGQNNPDWPFVRNTPQRLQATFQGNTTPRSERGTSRRAQEDNREDKGSAVHIYPREAECSEALETTRGRATIHHAVHTTIRSKPPTKNTCRYHQ